MDTWPVWVFVDETGAVVRLWNGQMAFATRREAMNAFVRDRKHYDPGSDEEVEARRKGWYTRADHENARLWRRLYRRGWRLKRAVLQGV